VFIYMRGIDHNLNLATSCMQDVDLLSALPVDGISRKICL